MSRNKAPVQEYVYTRPSDEELRRMYVEEGLSAPQISKRVGCPVSAVYRWMDVAKIPRRPRVKVVRPKAPPRHDRPRKPLEERLPVPVSELKRLYLDEQMSYVQIAARIGANKKSVKGWLIEAGVELRPYQPPSTKIPLAERCPVPIEDLTRMYVDERMSLQQISDRVGVPFSTVAAYLKENGVQMRAYDPSERFTYEDGYRKVVSRKEETFDYAHDGTPLTVTMEYLECGHKVPKQRRYRPFHSEHTREAEYRRCYRCVPKEQS